MPELGQVHHIALTVRDLDVSTPWYTALFGGQKIMEMREDDFALDYLLTPGGVGIGLHSYPSTGKDDPFDEFRVGLDHLSFHCDGRAEVEAWQAKLDELGVSHSGISDVPYGHVLVFRDPDNIQLEFFSLPS